MITDQIMICLLSKNTKGGSNEIHVLGKFTFLGCKKTIVCRRGNMENGITKKRKEVKSQFEGKYS